MSTPNDTRPIWVRPDDAANLSNIAAILREHDWPYLAERVEAMSAAWLEAPVADPGGRAAPPPTTPEGAQESAGSSSTTSRITNE